MTRSEFGSIQPLSDAALAVLEHLTLEPRERPPRPTPSLVAPLETSVYLLDVALGGVVPGKAHVVTSSDRRARRAVLAELTRSWPGGHRSSVILAGLEPVRRLTATMLGAPSGVDVHDFDSGLETGRAWNRVLVRTSQLLDGAHGCLVAGRVCEPEDLETALAARRPHAPVGLVVIDLDDVGLDELDAWTELAARQRFALVAGLDPRSDAARRHDLPELSLARLGRSPSLVRYAAHGVRIDGTHAPRLIVDVDPATLAVTTYDPRNEHHAGEPPEPADLELCVPELTWGTRDGLV